jgi:transcriptional regulator with XRE-family HTH domain
MNLGERLRSIIYQAGFKNLADASLAVGIDAPSLSRITNNKQTPSADRLLRISEYFNVSVDWLLTGKEPGGGQSQHISQRISGNHINTNQVVIGHGSRHIVIKDSGQGKDLVLVINELFPKLSPGHQKTIIELIQLYSKEESNSTSKE